MIPTHEEIQVEIKKVREMIEKRSSHTHEEIMKEVLLVLKMIGEKYETDKELNSL